MACARRMYRAKSIVWAVRIERQPSAGRARGMLLQLYGNLRSGLLVVKGNWRSAFLLSSWLLA